jgi:hypothetical protein
MARSRRIDFHGLPHSDLNAAHCRLQKVCNKALRLLDLKIRLDVET